MKTITSLLITFLISFSLTAQDITGQWNGILKVQGAQVRLVFNIAKSGDFYSSTMDSPDQGQEGIPITNTSFENPKIKLKDSKMRMEYEGELKGGEIVGYYKQGGHEFPMILSREVVEQEGVKRDQEPRKPYPYYSEEVTFQNPEANISLSGTLTLPEKVGIFPVVVLISGSGPQNRDEEIVGHKPFLVISDYLTRHGIGVLRYDDRGVGQSEGDFKTANSADFASDVESAIGYLKTRKEINKKFIGLVGHSEGGIIAPMVASKLEDVSYVVLLAGPGIRGDKLLLLQQELIFRASGASEEDIAETIQTSAKVFEMLLNSEDDSKLEADLTLLLNEMLETDGSAVLPDGMTKEEFVSQQVNQTLTPWMLYYVRFDPAFVLEKVSCPVLAVNGAKDTQVPSGENLSAIEDALTKGGNSHVTVKEFPELNHLFQECETGYPSEYATIEQTFSPVVLDEITKWMLLQTK